MFSFIMFRVYSKLNNCTKIVNAKSTYSKVIPKQCNTCTLSQMN